MKTRTCPYCNHQYTRIDYVKKLLLKLIWSKWDCSECGEKITFDSNRRIWVALVFGVWYFILNMIIIKLEMNLSLWILFLFLFLIGSIFIFTFDNFKKSK